MKVFRRVLTVIVALIIFWTANFVVNNLLVSAFINEKDVSVFAYMSVISITTVSLISIMSYFFYKYLLKKWGASVTVEVFLFIVAITYYIVGMNDIQTLGVYSKDLTGNYQIFCASIAVYAICLIFFIAYKASNSKAQTYNEYKAIEIVQTSYYENTRVRIPAYMSDYAQDNGGDKYIGWRAKKFSKEIYLVYFEFTAKGETKSFCFEANLETKKVRAVTVNEKLKEYYLEKKQ